MSQPGIDCYMNSAWGIPVARAPRAGCYGRQDRGSGPRPVRADSVPQVEWLIRQSRVDAMGS